MSIRAPIVIEGSNLSLAWARALLRAVDAPKSDIRPLLISVGNFDGELPDEAVSLRDALDAALKSAGMNPTRVSALTIFPYEIWKRRGMPSLAEFGPFCIERLLPRLHKLDKRNRHGTYFSRMMDYSGLKHGLPERVNQLQFVVELMRRDRQQRESALQIACFDPAKDHTGQPVRGFPCLQQIGISYGPDGSIAINAFYPTQYIFDRAYGNYLGLCQLGHFIARETDMTFRRLNCFVGKPVLGDVPKRDIKALVGLSRSLLSVHSTPEQEEAHT